MRDQRPSYGWVVVGVFTAVNFGGWLFDVTGSYQLTFLAAAVAIAGSSVAAWLAARPHSPPTRPDLL